MAPLPVTVDVKAGVHGAASEVHEVWASNFDSEFDNLLAAASDSGSGGAILALDMEFPGFLRQEPRCDPRSDGPIVRAARYQALRENVDSLRPIQLGAAVAGPDGVLRGVWSFNLYFNLEEDRYTEKAVAFLRAAGIDFQRHAKEGLEATELGRRLAGSGLVNRQHNTPLPWWVTFSGSYDLGYLMKLLTANRPLPESFNAYDAALAAFCPRRHELRDQLPHGSLESLARKHGLQRRGMAHTAGSDALLTLELYLAVKKDKLFDTSRWAPWALPGCSWDANSDEWYTAWDPAAPFPAAGWDNAARWDVANMWDLSFIHNPSSTMMWPLAGGFGAPPLPGLSGSPPLTSAASFWAARERAGYQAVVAAAAAAAVAAKEAVPR